MQSMRPNDEKQMEKTVPEESNVSIANDKYSSDFAKLKNPQL